MPGPPKRVDDSDLIQYTDTNYWHSLILLALIMAIALPALFIFPSVATNKMQRYLRNVSTYTLTLGGTIAITWMLGAAVFKVTE